MRNYMRVHVYMTIYMSIYKYSPFAKLQRMLWTSCIYSIFDMYTDVWNISAMSNRRYIDILNVHLI